MSTEARTPIRGCWLGIALGIALAAAAMAQEAQGPPAGRDLSDNNKTLYTISTAHLDTQWRWTIQDTITRFLPATLQRNFEHFQRSPNYVFSFEGAFRYMLAKEYYPEEYGKLWQFVNMGRWRVAGSAVDAGDTNMVSPESLMRQVLYGNGFFKREFGKTSCDIFLPDCFGFGYALPSIAAHCGLKGFSTQKLGWGSAIDVPFGIGRWEGPDGASIVAALKPGGYTSNIREDLSRNEGWLRAIDELGEQSQVYAGYKYFGVGDTGGATDPESVDWLDKSIASDGPVKVVSAGSDQLFRDLTQEDVAALPDYKGELLLTTHGTGCYTSQAAMKRWNRKNELLGDAAERAGVIANWVRGELYPSDQLREAWVRFLWHQFHDDLPGTSIPQAYTFSWNDELLAQKQFADVLQGAMAANCRVLDTRVEGTPLVVYNPLSVDRQDVVRATIQFTDEVPTGLRVYGPEGSEAPSQVLSRGPDSAEILLLAQVPSVGFAVYDVRPAASDCPAEASLTVTPSSLENRRYLLSLDDNGDVSSIRDKKLGRELLSSPVRLELLRDFSPRWPAWEILYRDVMREPAAYADKPVEARVVESGPVRATIELTRYVGDSTVIQRISLASGQAGDQVEFDTRVGWRTRGMMLKAAFGLSAANPMATYDLGLGTIRRPNNTPRKYEVPAQQWADITDSDGSAGVAILSDCKYGWDKPADNTLRLTLLHTPKTSGGFSDQKSQDLGRHQMRYGVYGHPGDWRDSFVSWQGARFNQPLMAFQPPKNKGLWGREFSMLQVNTPHVAVKALKRTEEGGTETVVRLQELAGRMAGPVTVSVGRGIVSAREINGAEEPLGDATVTQGKLVTALKPYQPRTFALTLADSDVTLTKLPIECLDLPLDRDVVTLDDDKADGAFDDQGHSFPGEFLPGLLSRRNVGYRLGHTGLGENNAVSCNGQVIELGSGEYDYLYLLAACAGEDTECEFKLGGQGVRLAVPSITGNIGQWDSRMVDGGVAHTYRQLQPAFVKPQTVALVATHRHRADGVNEPYVFCYLFEYAVPLPAGASSLTLPEAPHVLVFAATLARTPWRATLTATPLVDAPVQITDLPPRVSTLPPRKPDNPTDVVKGLRMAYYEGRFETVESFKDAEVVRWGEAASFAIPSECPGENFALAFEGFVEAPADGTYTFYTASDDGSVLLIGDAVVVDNDGLHSHGESLGDIALSAGRHAVRVLYFQGPGDRSLQVSYEGPGIAKQPIPDSVLYRTAAPD